MQRNTKNKRMGKTKDLFKKMRDIKGTFHAKMGTIKDRNGMDLTEAEDIKKRWQEYTELHKKALGICLVIQWLRFCGPNAGSLGSIPGQGTRSHMLQLRVFMPQRKIPCAKSKIRYSQVNKC